MLEACITILKLNKIISFQIIAGVVNIERFENTRVVQVRNISNYYTPANIDVDLAIAKVNIPFMLIYTVKRIVLMPAGLTIPGIKSLYCF